MHPEHKVTDPKEEEEVFQTLTFSKFSNTNFLLMYFLNPALFYFLLLELINIKIFYEL
jgi:hypothetical protein